MFQKFTSKLVALSAIAATLSISISSAASAAVTYQIDDGKSEAAVGGLGCNPPPPPVLSTTPTILGDLMWLNSFNTKTGGEFINSIDVVWGAGVTDPCTGDFLPTSGLSNKPAKVFLYSDLNNDKQLELLVEQETIVQPPVPGRPDIFSRIILKQPQKVSGTFYVAALFPNQTKGQYPAALDIPSANMPPRKGQSWLVFSVYSSLGATPLPKLDNPYNEGYWLLRANGSGAPPKSVPESTSAISLVAIATLSAGTLLKRKSRNL